MPIRSGARIKIFGRDLDPDEVTSRLGLTPTRVLRAGHPRPRTSIVEKEGLWELKSDLPEDRDLAEHVASVLGKVVPLTHLVREMSGQYTVLLACIVHAPSEPPLALSRDAVGQLAALGAEVDFDLYIGDEG
jgi:hypothetical protein